MGKEMQNIVWKNESGDILVTHVIELPETCKTVQEYAAHMKEIDSADANNLAGFEAVAFNVDVPEDRTFRAAWTVDQDAGISHDMGKAREVWRDRIRAERAPKLAALDIQYQKADERDDAALKKEIAAQKQALRDATKDPRIDAATDTDSLKEITV